MHFFGDRHYSILEANKINDFMKAKENDKKQLELPTWLQKNKKVWARNQQTLDRMFQQALVIDIDQKNFCATVELADGSKRRLAYNMIEKLTYDEANDMQDMVDLEELSQAELLHNVERRYKKDLIFTYCGPTLLVVNPYKKLQSLFDLENLVYYQIQTFCDNFQYKSNPPHIYALSSFAAWQLFDNNKNQSIVISGQSGAGKTQNTKFSLNFLASITKNLREVLKSQDKSKYNQGLLKRAEKALRKAGKGESVFGIEQKILSCNDILEGFGNAKTIRNDNSSRFGKLIILIYGESQFDIKGAYISSYLLEKSRICSQSIGERNYHAFYYLLKGADKATLDSLHLSKKMQEYCYINQGKTYEAGERYDAKEYEKVNSDFLTMGFSEEERSAIWKIVSAVILFGQVKFTFFTNEQKQEAIQITSQNQLEYLCELLGARAQDVEKALTTKVRSIGGATIVSPLKIEEAYALRDSFARCLYEKSFLFMVEKLNRTIRIDEKTDMLQLISKRDARRSIGVLDIFGFEVLKINSLEQVFINFANQKLQQLYVKYIFKEEKEVFYIEGLKEFAINFQFEDNQPVIDFFQNPPVGLFFLLNEASQLNKPQSAIIQSIVKNLGKNACLQMPKGKSQIFTILHSCSSVDYNVTAFSLRNKDQIPAPIAQIFKNMNPVVSEIVLKSSQKQAPNQKFLSSKFLNEMNKLIDELNSCDCHFVRCIKSNTQKKANLFAQRFSLTNMRYLGVLDSIRIRKLGYIYRRSYKDFVKKFGQILHYKSPLSDPFQALSEEEFVTVSKQILNKHAPDCQKNKDVLFGKQKILIKEKGLNALQFTLKERKKYRIMMSNKIKTCWKLYKFRKGINRFFKLMKKLKRFCKAWAKRIRHKLFVTKVIKIQKTWREIIHRRRLKKNREKNKKIAGRWIAIFRMLKQRRIYQDTRNKIIKIQVWYRNLKHVKIFQNYIFARSILRTLLDRWWLRFINQKALLIQTNYRAFRVRKIFKQKIDSIRQQVHMNMLNRKARTIQLAYRAYRFHSYMRKHRNAILVIQNFMRSRWICKVYRRVLIAAMTIQRLSRTFILKRMTSRKVQNQTDSIFQRIRTNTSTNKNRPGNRNALWFEPLDVQFGIEHESFVWWQGLPKGLDKILEQLGKDEQISRIQLAERNCYVLTNRYRIFQISEKKTFQWGSHLAFQWFSALENPCFLSCKNEVHFWGHLDWPVQAGKEALRSMQLTSVVELFNRRLFVFNYNYIIQQRRKLNQDRIILRHFKTSFAVKKIVCSLHFCHLLGSKGELWALGLNNLGQLGRKDVDNAFEPVQIPYFKTNKLQVQNLSNGLQHSVCLLTNGKVYVWGSNAHGQLGKNRQELKSSFEPLKVQAGEISKFVQVSAGVRSTLLLSDELSLFWCGYNSKLKRKGMFQRVKVAKGLHIVRVQSSWNRTFSMSWLHVISKDLSKSERLDIFLKECRNLSKSFTNNNSTLVTSSSSLPKGFLKRAWTQLKRPSDRPLRLAQARL